MSVTNKTGTPVGSEVFVSRYTGVQRVNHWLTAALFTLLGLSGLAMFSPYLFFLTGIFGGGQSTRAVHPWLGVLLMLSFAVLFVRFWRLNVPNGDDVKWLIKLPDILRNRHQGLPPLGKYNAGQKAVFWSQSALIILMFTSGIVIWDQYFATYTLVDQKRAALLIHSLAAILAISIILVHVYAGLWIRGTSRAMMRGSVTGGWAHRHHLKWFQQAARAGKVHTEADSHGD